MSYAPESYPALGRPSTPITVTPVEGPDAQPSSMLQIGAAPQGCLVTGGTGRDRTGQDRTGQDTRSASLAVVTLPRPSGLSLVRPKS